MSKAHLTLRTLRNLIHLQRSLYLRYNKPTVSSMASKMALQSFDINSKYKMNSGYEIPVLGYGVCYSAFAFLLDQSLITNILSRRIFGYVFCSPSTTIIGRMLKLRCPTYCRIFWTKTALSKIYYCEHCPGEIPIWTHPHRGILLLLLNLLTSKSDGVFSRLNRSIKRESRVICRCAI